jgi:hypothetical protein
MSGGNGSYVVLVPRETEGKKEEGRRCPPSAPPIGYFVSVALFSFTVLGSALALGIDDLPRS